MEVGAGKSRLFGDDLFSASTVRKRNLDKLARAFTGPLQIGYFSSSLIRTSSIGENRLQNRYMQTTPTAAPSPFAREASPLGVRRWVPGLNTLLDYQTAWIAKDVVAGVALTAILIPVGMGYAEASGLPPIQGLYASIIPLLVYALFGPSRILVLGPDSSLAAIILDPSPRSPRGTTSVPWGSLECSPSCREL